MLLRNFQTDDKSLVSFMQDFTVHCKRLKSYPGHFRSWESPQTLPALFIGPFEHVERFRNLKFAPKRITDIQSTVLSFSESKAAIHRAFK